MVGELGDLTGRDGGKRTAVGTGAAAAAAPEAAPTRGTRLKGGGRGKG